MVIFLVIYILGMFASGWLIWKINQREKKVKHEITEKMFWIYCILISWIGALSLLAGQLAGFNELHRDEN